MKKTLVDIRKEKDISQEAMANKLNIAISTYCQYETGKRNIPVNIVDSICEILDIKEEDIFLPIKFTVGK